MADEPLIDAWIALMRARTAALARVEARLKADGLPPLEWYDVLWQIERSGGPQRPRDLVRALLVAQPNLSRLLDRLEREGLIERGRCPADGRGQLVALTDAGRALRARVWPSYRAAIEGSLAALGKDGAREATRLLSPLLGR